MWTYNKNLLWFTYSASTSSLHIIVSGIILHITEVSIAMLGNVKWINNLTHLWVYYYFFLSPSPPFFWLLPPLFPVPSQSFFLPHLLLNYFLKAFGYYWTNFEASGNEMTFQDHTEKWSERTAITVECLNQVISFPFTLCMTGILIAFIFLPEEIEDKGPYTKKLWP